MAFRLTAARSAKPGAWRAAVLTVKPSGGGALLSIIAALPMREISYARRVSLRPAIDATRKYCASRLAAWLARPKHIAAKRRQRARMARNSASDDAGK